MQLRVTLPSKGGSGSGGSGGGGGFLGAADLAAAFFALACASFCCFFDSFAGVGIGGRTGVGAVAGAVVGAVVGIIGWKLAVVWIGDGCGAGGCWYGLDKAASELVFWFVNGVVMGAVGAGGDGFSGEGE